MTSFAQEETGSFQTNIFSMKAETSGGEVFFFLFMYLWMIVCYYYYIGAFCFHSAKLPHYAQMSAKAMGIVWPRGIDGDDVGQMGGKASEIIVQLIKFRREKKKRL